MKKLLLFAAAALMLFACSKEDEAPIQKLQQGNASNIVFHVTTEGSPVTGTKVYADKDLKLLWNDGDLVSVFEKNDTIVKYKASVTGGNSVDLLPAEDDEEEKTPSGALQVLDHYYAVYPYSNTISVSKGSDAVSFGLVLPDVQNYKENSFGEDANTMVAVTDGKFLPFKNVCGYLCFRFYGNNIKVTSVKLEGKNGEKIAGNAIVTAKIDDYPSVVMQSDATGSITIDCGDGIELSNDSAAPTQFIFVVPTITFSKGFKVTVTRSNGDVFEMKTPDTFSLKIQRNRLEYMKAKEVVFNNQYELVTLDKDIKAGDYVLAYHNGNGGFNLFSFTKTMDNAEDAAALVADEHSLSGLLSRGSEIYAKVVGKNYLTVAGEKEAPFINIPSNIEDSIMLSVTGNANSAQLTLVSGEYSLRLDKVITKINDDNSATLAVQPNAPDAIAIMNKLRYPNGNGSVRISFNELINFAVEEAENENITFTPEQIDRLKSGFEHACRLAKEILANHDMNLMTIDLNTNIFDVIAQYYDNAADYSYLTSKEKLLGFATPIGFYAGDDGFTANISLPQAGWFDRVQQSLHYGGQTKADFVAYWKTIDADPLYQNGIAGQKNFFERLANRFVNELDDSTFDLLKTVDFSAIGRVYGNYVSRFNDQLEPVYLYKKVVE